MLLYPSIRVYEKSRLDALIKVFLCEKSVYPLNVIALGLKKELCFLSHMPKKVRVVRSAFCFCCCQNEFCGQNRRKIRVAKIMVKHCENSIFRVIVVKKKEQIC